MPRYKLFLVVILVLAAVLRFFNLGSNPPSLNWDEVSHGYNAFSILKTGQDEWGQFLPWANFRAYGDYPLPVYMYLAMPGIHLFGLNEFSVRIPSALFGTLTVLLAYLISKRVFKSTPGALLAALLMAVAPWGILPSRQVLQSTPAVFFFSLGIWLFLKGVSEQRKWVVLGAISLGISAYTYHNARILAPMAFLLLLILFRKKIRSQKKAATAALLAAALFFLPLVPIVFSGQGSARAAWVGILDEGAVNRINQSRSESRLPAPLPKLLENKVVYFAKTAVSNYAGYFSPQFLGHEGGTQYQFSVPRFGVIYPVELPFFYLGLGALLVGFSGLSGEKKFLLGWLLLAPLPAAVTRDPFQVLRSALMLPAVPIVIGYGFIIFFNFVSKRREMLAKLLTAAFFLALFIFFVRYMSNLWFIYPKAYSFAWQYGYKQVAEYIKAEGSKYPRIVITKKYGEPHEFLLFHLQYDPTAYRSDSNLVRYEKSSWFWVDRFNKFEFINDWEVKEKLAGASETLLVSSPGNYPTGGSIIKTINFLDGQPAFELVKY